MSRCKRCNQPCSATAIFCDECRTLLQDPFQTEESIETSEARERQVASLDKPSLLAMSSTQENGESSNLFARNTSPIPAVQDVHTPLPPVFIPLSPPPSSAPQQMEVQQTYNMVEQALNRLNEAARRIAQAEGDQQSPAHHPRASRLTPLRDISAEIQRESTPLPKVSLSDKQTNTNTHSNTKNANANMKGSEQGEDLARRMPDLWPWMQEAEADENDVWANRTDPLLARHFPTSGEAERIEQEDVRRARTEGWNTRPLPRASKPGTKRVKRLRIAFVILASLAVLALLVDGLLASLAFIHAQHPANTHNGPPALTLSSNVAIVGQTLTLRIRSFSPSTQVYLTHDIQQPVETSNGTGLIKVGAMGDANVPMVVDASWGPGFHIVYAEDVKTRYTASSTLQIVRSGSTRPSQLDVGSATLDLGTDFQGSNTIQPLILHNSGDGAITWAASSNQPWLLISPPQGTFSASQTIEIAVERYNLKPGVYDDGVITFSNNVGVPVYVHVQMTVRSLPANAGAVLAVTPAVLSFTGLDGALSPSPQVLTINNPGSQPLSWSLASNTPAAFTFVGEDVLLHLFGTKNWLSTNQISGVVEPGGTSVVRVFVNSQIILPGVYTDNLVFTSGSGTIDSPQDVSVSLTVLPRCGLTLSSWSASFTTVIGQGNPSNQALGLSATSSCTNLLSWNAQSSASWLTLTPASGQLKGAASTVTAIGVNTAGLKAGSYQGTISFLTATATQTVVVSLLVQSPPPAVAPIMAASPLNLNFSATQGATNPLGQVVTITNNGGGTLYWHTTVSQLATAWLGASPTGGSIGKGQTGQVTVNVATGALTPGTYMGQIGLSGSDASGASAGGSPQTIAVNLLVLPTCSMAQPSSSTLTFNATTGGPNPASQPLSITASGNCGWPLNWQAHITGSARWLTVSSASGLIAASGQSATTSVGVNATSMAPGKYSAHISITATDSSGATAQGSPQVVAVTLIVQSPCSLQVSAGSLAFSAPQGQAASQQSLTVSEAGNCARPVSWTAMSDGGSASWLSVSPTSGSDGGSGGTIIVSVTAANLIPGNFSGSITISAKDSGGATIQGSPQTVSVNLTVTGFSLSGSVVACADSTCATPAPLPGATVVLLNSSGTQVATLTADGSGNFSFSNLPSGSYTLSVTGTLNATSYTGTKPVTLSGNQSNIMVDVLPG